MILTWLMILHCLALNVIGNLIILPKFSWMGAGLVPCPPLPSDTTGGQFDTPNAADTFVWKPVLLPGTAKGFEIAQKNSLFSYIISYIDPDLYKTILKHGQPYRGGMRTCDLCLTEKLCILDSQHKNLLNKRREILNKCRHMNKFLLRKSL